MAQKKRKDFVCFKSLTIGAPVVESKRIKTKYTLRKLDGSVLENELIYTYEEKVFDPGDELHQNLASMMSVQVAFNYGLFCKKIIFQGLFTGTDKRFILNMMENTSREIYVNKLLQENPFIVKDYTHLPVEKSDRYTAAELDFLVVKDDKKVAWKHLDGDLNSYVILSSGGKDSLLSYGIMKELGKEVHPVFINESGRHWFSAINAYKHLDEIEPNTAKVWCNSDRIFNWVLRNMPFIRENFEDIRADIYPIRLWTVAVFLFGVIPLSIKRKSGRILIGDEYDSTQKINYNGITHYNSLYDQSKYFDNALTRYFLKKGWNKQQFSILRSLSELLILKVLVDRYPDLQQHQISCHAAHERDGKIYPCGNCEKCRRIVGMLIALEKDPKRCGYTEDQIQKLLLDLGKKKVKQLGADGAQLYYMLVSEKKIPTNDHTNKIAKEHPYILRMRFDRERSNPADMPSDLRMAVFSLLRHHTEGAVTFQNRTWMDFQLENSHIINSPYPFEIKTEMTKSNDFAGQPKVDFLWELLTWKEIEERLKHVDTAILPTGAIEQHGPHLPVDIDYFDAKHLAFRVAQACSDPRPFVLPPIPYGVSYHHEEFKGTISVTNDALSRFIYDIGLDLARSGIKKLIILNGHGDNAPTLKYAAQMINRDAKIFVCVETGETSDTDLLAMTQTHNDIHAGDIETSTTLAVRPELVQMDKAENETLRFGSSYLDFTSSRGVPWYVHTNYISHSGIMGDATKATAEKGEKMWQIMISQLVQFVEEIKSAKLEELYQKRY